MSTPNWTIIGEAGKALDTNRRAAGEVGLGPGNTLELTSLDVDTLSWTVRAGIVPDLLQKFSLWRDGERVFSGRVTQRKYVYDANGGSAYAITVSGALWEMSKATILDTATDGTGGTDERPTIQFSAGDLRDMIIRLLDKAPGISVGSVAPMFNVGRRTFTSGTWLAVLGELLKPVADGAAWVDYSVEPPTLHITRRREMAPLELQVGVDPVARVELNPRIDLQVTGIRLASATRNAAGKVVFSSQQAGDGSQIVAVSGPEVGAFVPPDNLPSVTIRTAALDNTMVRTLDSGLSAIYNQFTTIYGGISSYLTRYTGSSSSKVYDPIYFPATWYRDEAGNTVDPTGKYLVVSGSLPDWAVTLYGATRVTVSGSWADGATGSAPTGTQAAVWEAIKSGGAGGHAGYANDIPGDSTAIHYASRQWSIQATLINTNFPTDTVVYEPGAYEFLQPPAGMAEGMLAAADFVPWEGQVRVNPGFAWQRVLARRLRVIGADPELATAIILTQGVSIDLATGAFTLRCGAPGRVSMASVASRYSPSPKDNIVQV